MKSIPKPFGYPLIVGCVKKRLAKKLVDKCHRTGPRDMWKRFHEFDGFKVGDLVAACQQFNEKVVKVEPVYAATKHGQVLVELDFTVSDTGGCSMYHCGVEPARSYADLRAEWDEGLKIGDGGDPEGYDFSIIPKTYTLNPDGTATKNATH